MENPGDKTVLGVAAAIQNEKNELLLLLRSDFDMWCMPGGIMEFGESAADCLRREVREEIGVEAEPVSLLGIYTEPSRHLFTFRDGHRVHYVTFAFRTRIVKGTPRVADHESRRFGFFSADALPRIVPSHAIWIHQSFVNASGCVIA